MTPSIFLACPMRPDARPHYLTALACERATDSDLQVSRAYAATSLLPLTFNQLWAGALNAWTAGRVTHFAMIHDDIHPGPGWLDTLVREMARFDADLVSAVVPIKDGRGITSTAVEKDDRWNPRRLTMREVFKIAAGLPAGASKTFGSYEAGGPLLVNTGLWLCKLGDWATRVHFRQTDRIVLQASGEYEPQTQSEDWDFSRQVREATGRDRVYATLAVPLDHERPEWTNRRPWGQWETDELHLPPKAAEPAKAA